MDALSIQNNIRDDRATVANDVNSVIFLPSVSLANNNPNRSLTSFYNENYENKMSAARTNFTLRNKFKFSQRKHKRTFSLWSIMFYVYQWSEFPLGIQVTFLMQHPPKIRGRANSTRNLIYKLPTPARSEENIKNN